MEREDIIAEVARTLFVCAWADGVERGELAGEGPGPGGDWAEAAPGAGDPAADRTARLIVDAFDERAADTRHRYVVEAPALGGYRRVATGYATLAEARAEYRAQFSARNREGSCQWLEETEPSLGALDALKAAVIRAGSMPDALVLGWLLLRDRGEPACLQRGEVTPIEGAASIHAELSGTDRFTHCLAMTALGHGVGLEDDLPPGARLPGWIRASVISSDFGPHALDLERYPPPET